jgi:hypothetical protein
MAAMAGKLRVWIGCLVAAASAAGCGGDGGSAPADASADAVFASCTNDPRAEPYRAGLAKPGEAGLLTFTLVGAQPAPPIKGTNQWTVRITDAAGAPVDGLTVTATSIMPDHNHGSSVKPTVRAGGAPGAYVVDTLYFFMLGLWRVTLATEGAAADTAAFQFCVTQ